MTSDTGPAVQVLYALPNEQVIVELPFEPGMTAVVAVARSGLAERFRLIVESDLVLGVWGVEVEQGQQLRPGDRVEISRPLQADPREMRRDFMTDGRVMGGAPAPNRRLRKTGRE